MKISCKVMEDILPLYVDECCSDDTKELVDQHLMECDGCREKLETLRKPMFLSNDASMDEKSYVKHTKRAFKKLRRRWIALTVAVIILLCPLIWLGVNQVRGEGISYTNLKYVIRANALLNQLKKGNYEKAFRYLKLKAWYDRYTQFDDSNLDLIYKKVKIGGDIFYVDESIYRNEYRGYLDDKDEASFWRGIYLSEDYMIPVPEVEQYLNSLEMDSPSNYMKYSVNGKDYYINGERYGYDSKNVGDDIFKIMPEEYYIQVRIKDEEEQKENNKFIQKIIDRGYDAYVSEYKQQWINNFKELEKEGVTIEGYKITDIYFNDNVFGLDFQLKLNVNGKINNKYGITFSAKGDKFYPNGGSISNFLESADGIPIIGAFEHEFNFQ